jgi:PAS domain S-box-containing protein
MDVSGLKETELKLRESEERFHLVTRATREAVWDWELSRGTVWRSEGFTVLFGYQPDDIEDQLSWWVERIHPDDRPRVLAQLPTPGEDTPLRQCSYEYRFRRRDGTYADVLDRGFFMFRADGVVYRMVGSMLDLTERHRAEELAHMHRAELAHIARVRTMGEIATGLAHELNQPLTAIANYAESCAQALSAGGPNAHKHVAGWLEKIVSNTDRAGQMIRRLRGFTRKSEPRRSTVEINDLVQEVIDLLEAESRLQEVRVRWNSIPPAYALLDRVQVQQVLVNLLRNAHEAMAALPPDQRQVVITALSRGRHLQVSVEDCGEGIPEENLPRVFDAFFTNKADGVGVGLAISRSIIEDHGGRLWVEPNASRGVTFYFTVPQCGD